uniref:Phospholipid/glycerol acyltransferase domain-containing protein n=1 Tax=Acrobeloides nanus TaxID=290746 RepID=A0A914DLZ0_9BILA
MVVTIESLLVISTLLFPPVLFIVILILILASFGTSLGLRERYVGLLISIFEWSARQIQTTAELKRRESRLFYAGEDDETDEDEGYVDPMFDRWKEMPDDVDSGIAFTQCTSPTIRSNISFSSLAQRRQESNASIIARETTLHLDDLDDFADTTYVNSRGWAVVQDSLFFVKAGVEAIIEDEVTSRFQAEQLASWNMMTRTSIRFYQFINWKLTLLWILGWFFRYVILTPLRCVIFMIGMGVLILTTALVGLVPEGKMKRFLNERCMLASYQILGRAVSAVIYFHDVQNKAKNGGICVANHTSPLDVMILSTDNVYALVGQQHGGLLGFIQRTLSRASAHIWFERSESKDRSHVVNILKEHVDDPNKLPILIFPEGTCINNTSVMMFKKGSFEVGAKVYPIAMKYDSRFGDAFWNSSEQSWAQYICQLMTSWATVCDVWYLPPMERLPDESAIDFANRVKKTIAVRGGLVDLDWDGQLKRSKVPPRLVAKQQEK